jgi:hypothetical protein
MKLFCAFTLFATAALAAVNPHLQEVKRVYILAMGSGMDQYLANQLTEAGVFEVVTDPKRADAIVTDSVGESFQNKLDDLYAPPKTEKTQPAANALSGDAPVIDTGNAPAPAKDAVPDFSGGGVRTSSFGRSKGNFFLVDRSSRVVLWSIYERPRNTTPGELTKTAARVVRRLQDDLTPKKPAEQ